MTSPRMTLFPHQEQHVQELKTILQGSPFAFDLSMLGAGKTYAASALGLDFRHVLVISPLHVKSKWESMRAYGPAIDRVMSYAEVRSKSRYPRHGYLTREETEERADDGTTTKRTTFHPTSKLNTVAQDSTLLILDEVQYIKNATAQTAACAVMIQTVIKHGGKVLLISGSPIDKPGQLITFFKTLGVMTHKLVTFAVHNRTFEYHGYNEIARFVERVALPLHPNAPASHEVLRMLSPPAGDIRLAVTKVYDMFQRLIKPAVARRMPVFDAPAAVDVQKRNGFYDIVDPCDARALEDAVDMLERVVGFDAAKNTVEQTGNVAMMSNLTKALMAIEHAKVGTFVRLARETLMRSPRGKVAICLNFREPIARVAALLGEFNPVQLHGGMGSDARAAALAAFQAPGGHRVIICNVSVCSTGIDMDDKHGTEPRTVFVSPNYHTITQYQLSHRFKRLNTRSNTALFMVYGRKRYEVKVLTALAKKSEIIKEVADGACGILPCDYEAYYEDTGLGHSGSSKEPSLCGNKRPLEHGAVHADTSSSDDDIELIEFCSAYP